MRAENRWKVFRSLRKMIDVKTLKDDLGFLCYTLVLSSNLMLYIIKANEPMIAAIEAKSIIPNMFSPFYFILSYLPS
jgi:hypothetical protein